MGKHVLNPDITWAMAFLRLHLQDGAPHEFSRLLVSAARADIPVSLLYEAARALCVRVSAGLGVVPFWRLPNAAALCIECGKAPRLFDSTRCEACQAKADAHWAAFKASHPDVL